MKLMPSKNKIYLFSLVLMFIIGTLLVTNLCSCNMLKGYRQDNTAEEFVEDMIEQYTGFDFDLSPATPEKSCRGYRNGAR